MLIVGSDHLATGTDVWKTNKGCFEYSTYIWKQSANTEWMIIDDVVGPIGAGSNELYLFTRQWEDVTYSENNFTNLNHTHLTGIYKYKFTLYDALSCVGTTTDTKTGGSGISLEAVKYD